jgi:hypothetical protein
VTGAVRVHKANYDQIQETPRTLRTESLEVQRVQMIQSVPEVALLYLKHAYNVSDETVCERWAQDVYFQMFFCGEEYFQPRLPCDPTNLVRFRQALGEAGVEELLAATIAAAVQMKAVTPVEFERVIVDTTVQEKAIAYPTDSRLLEVSRARLVQLAQRAGLALSKPTSAKASGCGAAQAAMPM